MDHLLNELHKCFPKRAFNRKDILATDAAIRPLAKPTDDISAHNMSREYEGRIRPTGVLHILGVKSTDHRRAAEQVVDQLVDELQAFNLATARRA